MSRLHQQGPHAVAPEKAKHRGQVRAGTYELACANVCMELLIVEGARGRRKREVGYRLGEIPARTWRCSRILNLNLAIQLIMTVYL